MTASGIEVGRMDELGRLDTPVHRIDARAKAVVTFAFVVVVMSFPRHAISPLMPLLLYPVAVMAAGHIPVRDIARKIAVAAPFAVLVGIANPWMDREPLLQLGSCTVTGGWLSFTSILVRFTLTVAAALILIATTGMFRLGEGLERLGAPRVFVMQLLFLYRYLFVVAGEGNSMLRAARMRGAHARGLGLRVYGSLVGTLLLRSLDRAERVYRAMLARGFDGSVRLLRHSRFGWPDFAYIAGWLTFFLAARLFNLAELLGDLISGGMT